MDCWYFAYGSNMSRAQMALRTGPIRNGEVAPRVAKLAGYQLAFSMLADDGRIYANIETADPSSDSLGYVLGVLYRCGPAEMAELDIYEEGYERRQVFVSDLTGRSYQAVVYIALPECTAKPGRPTEAYLDIILDGASEFELPNEYLDRIEQLASKTA